MSRSLPELRRATRRGVAHRGVAHRGTPLFRGPAESGALNLESMRCHQCSPFCKPGEKVSETQEGWRRHPLCAFSYLKLP